MILSNREDVHKLSKEIIRSITRWLLLLERLEKSAFNVVRRSIEAAQMANCSNISSFLGVAACCADLIGQVKDG